MRIISLYEDKYSSKTVFDPIGFMLTNKKGSYCSLGIDSKYSGFFCYINKKMYKVIDNISIEGKTTELVNNTYDVERITSNVTERFLLPFHHNALVYRLDSVKNIKLMLDFKESYDSREWGRHYEVKHKSGCIIVKFTKRTDSREDSSHNKKEYVLYLAIKGNDLEYKDKDEWVKRDYKADQMRGDEIERYVYHPFEIKTDLAVFAVSTSSSKAIKEANYVFDNVHRLTLFQKQMLKLNMRDFETEASLAYYSSLNSLHSLSLDKGTFAGLPWFFQFWARDELISLKATMQDDNEFAEAVINKYLKGLNHLINTHPNSRLKSADAAGWFFKRCKDYLDLYRTGSEKKVAIRNILKIVIDKLIKHSTNNSGFAVNKELETWMDTFAQDNDDDKRAGIRLEIQAMRLFMYKFMFELSGDQTYKKLEETLRKHVRSVFWNGRYLKDGAKDSTIRPNIFIAYYFYPELLSKTEWKLCMKNCINSLWLDWGGFASIDKQHPLYHSMYTGQDNRSYHRGDSWYWINNLAAICLYRLDKQLYAKYIDSIINASTRDILYMGYIGHASELSSASKQQPSGCFAQAWSAAMFIELMDEIYG